MATIQRPPTPNYRVIGRLGGLAFAAKHDVAAAAARARAGLEDKLRAQAAASGDNLSPDEIERRYLALRAAHQARMTLAASEAARRRRIARRKEHQPA